MAKFALGSPTSIPSGSADLPNLLASLGILVGTRTVTLPGELECLRGRFRLNREEEESLLTALDPILVTLGLVEPLLRRDLLQLRRGVAASEEHLASFCRFHVHDDDEGRYVVAGSCQFGFFLPGLGDLCLTLGPGDYLRIPAGTEHWFSLGEQEILQAIRLFSSNSAMSTTYTGRAHPPKWRTTASAKPEQLTGSAGGSISRARS